MASKNMPLQIQVPGKGVAEFPDGITYDQAFESIREDVPDFQPSREDAFNALRQRSESFAAQDEARLARSLGVPSQTSNFDYAASSAASMARGIVNAVPGAIGVAGGLQQGLGFGNFINERVRKPVEEFITDTFPVDPSTTTGLKGLLTTGVAQGAGQLVGSLLTGGLSKTPAVANALATASGTAQEFTDAWDREMERQAQVGENSPLKALVKSGGYAAIASALESKLGPGHLAEKIASLGEGKVNNIIVSAFKNAGAGGVEEFLQRIAQDLIVEGKPDWKAAAGEGLVGAVVQGGAGTTIDAAHNYQTKKNSERKAALENWISNQLAERAKLDTTREQSANELAQMVGVAQPHSEQDIQTRNALAEANAMLAQALPSTLTDIGLFQSYPDTGPGPVQIAAEARKRQGRYNVEAGLSGPATSYATEYAAKIPESQTSSGIYDVQPTPGDSPVDALLRSGKAPIATSGIGTSENTTFETSPVDAAILSPQTRRPIPKAHPEQQRVLDVAMQTLNALDDPKAKPDMSLVLQLEQSAPEIQKLVNARINQAIQSNALDSDLDPLIALQSKLKKFTDDLAARRQLSDEATAAGVSMEQPVSDSQKSSYQKRVETAALENAGFAAANTPDGKKKYRPAILRRGEIFTGESHESIPGKGGQHGYVDSSGKFLTLLDVARAEIASKPPLSTADKVYNKLDELDKGMNDQIRSSIFLGTEVAVAKLVLKTAKAAIRAGQAVDAAVRSAIAYAKTKFPDAKLDSVGLEKSIIADLHGVLSGKEEPSSIAQAAEPFVASNESADSKLQEESLYQKQLRMAHTDLRGLHDQVKQAALARDIPLNQIPDDPQSPALAEIAESLGLSGAAVQDLQKRVGFEGRARELKKAIVEKQQVDTAAEKLSKAPDKYAATIAFLQKASANLQKKISDKKYADVVGRANEIIAHENTQIQLKAQRDALKQQNVAAAITGPVEELRKLIEETPELADQTPADFLADPKVPDERKQNVVIRLSSLYREFDYHRATVDSLLSMEEEKLQRQIDRLTGKLRDAETEKAYADIVLEDAKKALSADTTNNPDEFTGGLNPKWLAWFDQNKSQLRSFAKALSQATGDRAIMAEKMLDWMRFGMDPSEMPDLKNLSGNNWGVGDEALNSIKEALLEAPAIRNAVMALSDAGNEKLAAHQLRAIATAAIGNEGDIAEELFQQLSDRTESERSKLIASARNTKKKLDDLRLRIETLRESKALFDKVATSPVFIEGRQTVEESDSSFMKPALSIDANGQFSLNGFKMPDGTEQQAVIAIGSGDSATKGYSRRVAEKLHEYHESAQAYVDGYEAAYANAQTNPTAPSPTALGYDSAVYRGLKHALQNELPAILDATAFSPVLNVDNSRNGLMQTVEWFTQLDATIRQIPNVFGGVARKALQLYGDAKLKIETVRNNPIFVEIGKLRTAAMDSHPTVGRNYDLYRKEIFNPMANRGRAFGLLKVGDTLYTGHVVTQADIDLMKRAKLRDMALIKIAQKYGKGQAQKFGGVEFRRKAGSVGDYGMARRVNQNGDAFIDKLANLFHNQGSESKITWENAGEKTDNPIVALLNEEAENNHMLKAHVEDSALRSDRNIATAPLMRMAYRSLNAALEAGGHVEQIKTVLDLANRLVEHFPSDTPYDPRTYVMEQLNAEFDQIAKNSLTIIEELNQVDPGTLSRIDDAKKMLGVNRGKSASNIDHETSNNEYTRPAAQLMLPSNYYNYGAITPVEMVNADARAVGERTVELKNAIRASADNLRSIKHVLESGTEAEINAISPEFAKDKELALSVVDNLISMIETNDQWLGADYVKPNVIFRSVKSLFGFGIASALSGTSVAAQNAFSSAFGGLILESQLNRYGRAMLALKALQYGAVVIRNTFYELMNQTSKAMSVAFKSALSGIRKSNPSFADSVQSMMDSVVRNKFVSTISKASGYANYSHLTEHARDIGFSQTKPFGLTVTNAWREALTYANNAEQEAGKSTYERGKLYTKAALKTGRAAVESALTFALLTVGDAAINATAIWQSNVIGDSLKDLAVQWAGDRIAKGMKYDLSNPDFIVKPDEYKATGTIGRVGAADVLAKARNLVKLTGTNLEWALWDYYRRSNGGKDKSVSFWGDHEDSVHRTFVGQINANNQTNRPTRSQNDPSQGMMQALTGFSSNVMTVMLQTLTSGRLSTSSGRERFKATLRKLMTIIFGMLAASVVGVFARAGVEFTNRLFNNALGRKMTGFEKEYWQGKPSDVAARVLKDALSVLPYSGAVVKMNDGQRPDIASGIFGVSFVNTIFNTLMGLKNLPMEDWGWLLRKSSSMVGASKLITGNMGDGAASRATINGVNAFASAADNAGLIPVKQSLSQAGGQVMTAKSGILGKLSEAGMAAQMAEKSGDAKGLEEANAEIKKQKSRLIQFHTDKIKQDNELRGITSSDEKVAKDAVAAARRDWQDMNPISRALGHAPTESELERINANLSGTRRAAADLGWSAFERMASSFPDSRGRVQEPQQMRQVRAGGGGRFAGGGMRALSGGSRFGYSAMARARVGGRVSLRGRGRIGGRSRISRGARGVRRVGGLRLRR